jgi:Sulfatase
MLKGVAMPAGKPNILVIWGDDIGITNLSCYSDGLMGYRTPNIDRIAEEGMRFTDSYGEQSCTAGRSAFITGQSVYRTGLSKVGMPGVDVGLQPEDPTIADCLKPLGYATGQFGKNHLGDLNKYLPTVHGFDEFLGNLYHLNAEEEPELPDYPTAEEAPVMHYAFLPRGVIHSWATEEDSGEVQERWGPVGKQRIEDTGPLTKQRMETIDDETTAFCIDFIKRQHAAKIPFFVWMNTTHMHLRTHTKPASLGQAGRWQSPYHDTMIDHDRTVGYHDSIVWANPRAAGAGASRRPVPMAAGLLQLRCGPQDTACSRVGPEQRRFRFLQRQWPEPSDIRHERSTIRRVMTPSSPWGNERGQLSHRLQVQNQILRRRQARRLSRRFARVGVNTPPERLRQMLAGAPVTAGEVADVNFAFIATQLKREQLVAKFKRLKRRGARSLLFVGLVLVTLNFLFCMAYALFSLTLEAAPL